MKKMISLLATLLLVLCLFPARASAEDTVYTEGCFYYTVKDNSITIVGYFGREREVTVPNQIAGVPVNAIGPGAFQDTTVEKLNLPDTIMVVGEGGAGDADVHYPSGDTAAPSGVPDQTEAAATSDRTEAVSAPDVSRTDNDGQSGNTGSNTVKAGSAAVGASGDAAADGADIVDEQGSTFDDEPEMVRDTAGAAVQKSGANQGTAPANGEESPSREDGTPADKDETSAEAADAQAGPAPIPDVSVKEGNGVVIATPTDEPAAEDAALEQTAGQSAQQNGSAGLIAALVVVIAVVAGVLWRKRAKQQESGKK